jgi:hypothetical protein
MEIADFGRLEEKAKIGSRPTDTIYPDPQVHRQLAVGLAVEVVVFPQTHQAQWLADRQIAKSYSQLAVELAVAARPLSTELLPLPATESHTPGMAFLRGLRRRKRTTAMISDRPESNSQKSE